jgi:Tol biopolymer transport system component
MPLQTGARLGPYEILAPLGAGGMGEVYRARDTRLDRTVAVKVLSPELSSDPSFRARFEREARTISSLSHPHICVLHDVGRHGDADYLVFEHLEGQTLEQRLKTERGGLKLAEALRIATEVADALDAAHRHGIVHRDLKPGNVMLTAAGAKLLDFGLAKWRPDRDAGAGSTLSTGEATPTAQGAVIGTLQYMAPEQLQGRDADARTDLFALGEVIYEMVTGRRAFAGETPVSVAAKILEVDPPPMSTVTAVSPSALDRVVQRCLAKDPEDRWQSARDVLLELRWVREGGTGTSAPPRRTAAFRAGRWLPWALAGAGLVAAGLAWVQRPAAATARPVVRFDVALPPSMSLEDWRGSPVLSPDGRLLVVPVALDGRSLLALRRLDDPSVVPLAGTEGGRAPFFSPSGRSLAFFADRKLKRLDLAGGPAVTLADVGGNSGDWNSDGVLLFAPGGTGLFRVGESGGQPQPVTTLDAGRGDAGHAFPRFLPDGRSFLFTVLGRQRGIYRGSLDSPDTLRLEDATSRGYYVRPGYLAFQRGRTLLAAPFDARTGVQSGAAFPIAEQVFALQYSATSGGDLAYVFDGGVSAQLVWFARDGRRLAEVGQPGPYRQIALSPSGRRVAIQRGESVQRGVEADIWVMDLATDVLSRLTTDPALETDPSWSPDERSLAFATDRTGRRTVFVKDLATGEERMLFEFPSGIVLDEWTPDGRFVVFRSEGFKIHARPMSGDPTPRALVDTPSATVRDQSHVSADGRFIAFNSDESGRWEVYVASFPAFANQRQVSSGGGMQPMWRRDGRELFYLSPRGELMSVEIGAGGASAPEARAPRALFRTGLNPSIQVGEYAVSPDGQRFLLLEPVGDRGSSVSLLLNWPAKHR